MGGSVLVRKCMYGEPFRDTLELVSLEIMPRGECFNMSKLMCRGMVRLFEIYSFTIYNKIVISNY